jgi:hypothetical protein
MMLRQMMIVLAATAAVAANPEIAAHGSGSGSSGSHGGGGSLGRSGGGSFSAPAFHSTSHGFSGGRMPSSPGFRLEGRSFYSPTFQEREPFRPRVSAPSFGEVVRPPATIRAPVASIPRFSSPGPTSSRFDPALPGGTGVSAARFPTIEQHLQSRGQNVEAWATGRQLALASSHQENAARLDQFTFNRAAAWDQLQADRPSRVAWAREGGAQFQIYRQNLWNYRYNRASQVRDRIGGRHDGLFTSDWWGRQRWFRGRDIGFYNPWWWWDSCGWPGLADFCGADWTDPIFYDYGANVIDQNGQVYMDGEDRESAADYAQETAPFAAPAEAPDAPGPPVVLNEPAEWKPFGVFALTQEQNGDAIMFFQLSVNRAGIISGAFTNVLADDTEPVAGSIDKQSQKAVWHVGDKTSTFYEAGAYNLTQDVTPVLIHFDGGSQTWLLVRIPSPDLPTAPTPTSQPSPE